jgi:hypothetical protein
LHYGDAEFLVHRNVTPPALTAVLVSSEYRPTVIEW